MVAIMPPTEIQDPSPQTPRYGLFSAAHGPLNMPDRYARGGGVHYKTAVTTVPLGLEVICESRPMTFKDGCGDDVTGVPFLVIANLTTGLLGMTRAEAESILLQRLKAGEQLVVEDVFCNRLFGASPSLVDNVPNATTLGATANIMDGVGALEAWLYARFGPRGVIHAPIALAARFQEKGIMSWDGSTWRTALGTAISFGNYSGNDADGDAPAAGHTNLYITGTTTIWRTADPDIEIPPFEGGIYYPENQLLAFARREWIVTHNGLLACVDVTIAGA